MKAVNGSPNYIGTEPLVHDRQLYKAGCALTSILKIVMYRVTETNINKTVL